MTVFLAVFCIVLVLLCIPVKISLKLREELAVSIGYLFFWKRILPIAERTEPPEPEADEPHVEKEERKERKRDAKLLGQLAKLVFELLPNCLRAVRRFVKRTTFAKIRIDFVVAREDAAETAIAFGRMNAVVHAALSTLYHFLRLKIDEIKITPNFNSGEERYEGEVEVRILPIALLAMAFNILFWIGTAFIKSARLASRQRKTETRTEEEKNYGTEPSHQ